MYVLEDVIQSVMKGRDVFLTVFLQVPVIVANVANVHQFLPTGGRLYFGSWWEEQKILSEGHK
jgi:hypothetical protein